MKITTRPDAPLRLPGNPPPAAPTRAEIAIGVGLVLFVYGLAAAAGAGWLELVQR
jgi:hypothetical protein